MIKALQTLRRIPFYHQQMQGLLQDVSDARWQVTVMSTELAILRRNLDRLNAAQERHILKQIDVDRLIASVSYSASEEGY